MNPHRIVVAGAGYAGVSWALKMERSGISGIQWVRGPVASESEAPLPS